METGVIVRQVRLVCFVRLQTNNSRLFLRKQTSKRQTSVCTIRKRYWSKENRLGFCFPFAFSINIHIDMYIFIYIQKINGNQRCGNMGIGSHRGDGVAKWQ